MSGCDKCVSTNINSAASDYSRPSVSAVAGYSTLGNYLAAPQGVVGGPPVVAGLTSTAVNLIPLFGGNGYNILQHGYSNAGMQGGYFQLNQAYPAYPNTCMNFVTRACSY